MTARDFCYWLQGYFEIHHGPDGQTTTVKIDHGITSDRVDVIKKHLALVFKHEIDPSFGGKEHQDELNNIHNTAIRC